MNELVKEGKSIIMISSEMTEILRMSDRVIVMCGGRKTAEIDIAEATQENIMHAATFRDSEEEKVNKIKNNPIVKKIGFNRIVLLCVLVLMYVIFAVLEPTFLSYPRILSALNYAYFLGFLALGATFVIATGENDFSIGTVIFCSSADLRTASDKE